MSNKAIIQKINNAFAQNDTEGFLAHCTDDIVFEMVGHTSVRGKDNVRTFMSEMSSDSPPRFTIDRVIEEGDNAVCTGDMEMEVEGEPAAYTYCDMYRFRDGKAAELRAFVIKQQPADAETERAAA